MDVANKVIVVTGGAGGIGKALCQRFARENAKGISVVDIDEEGSRSVADEVNGLAIRCDVSKETDIIDAVKQTERTFGPIDIFCSNAGILVMGGVEASNEDWQRIWEINLMAHVYAARAVIPGMIERGGGCFFITASAAGLLSQIGSTPYSVTKHAAVGLAENIAITYGDQGIQVFALCPQAVRSGMTTEGGGVAAVDGLLEPEQMVDSVMEAMNEDRFLILPHAQVQTYMERKASDYDRWLLGMRRLQRRYLEDSDQKS
ncbi:MAG: SDR family oxidoreductase [Desulfatiglans sp.]|jgi:NAD(P)-dependent dehydrogenase (short-subunit alcohol dehydrogenase family)|nr:SDR family oxidoreductase [Thermodesulfobacteriota bacterium]MEE4352072.1 SDR family oxidoreductase [Desulfatiglans sp.]